MKKLFTNLTFWVLIAVALGIVIGHFFPQIAQKTVLENAISTRFFNHEISIGKTLSEFLSGVFITIIKFFIEPIIFLTISLGIAKMGNLKKTGLLGFKAVIYFEIVTTIALLIGIFVANIIRPGDGLDASLLKVKDASKFMKKSEEFTWIKFFMDNPTLQAIVLALIFGILLGYYSKKEQVIEWMDKAASFVFNALHKVMLFAPIAAFGGMAFTVASFGVGSLVQLLKLMLTVYTTMACFIFIILGSLLWYYRISIWKFLKYIREELLIVLGTSSSEAGLPSLMEKLEKMGCSKQVVGLVVPTGYSFNLDGTTIYLSMGILFLSQLFQIHLDFDTILRIIAVLMITSKGAAGVTGSGFIVLTSTLTAVSILPPTQLAIGLGILYGVDRFMSEARAITNFIGNGVATVWLANNEKEFDRNKMNDAFRNVAKTEDILKDNLG